jgi:hypothetical protein
MENHNTRKFSDARQNPPQIANALSNYELMECPPKT